ncbi:MAG: metal-dependent hydrolase [Candidatus Altiarchaeota archaeon]|nr:metal-dependent hydrolase [Candidatus Altiarchaeota archaeon]
MDSLYHFVFALVGGYVLVKGLNVRYSFPFLVVLAFLSTLIDVDHLWQSQIFHNLFVLVPVLFVFFVSFLFKHRGIKLYSLVLFVMVFGHLLADMTFGIGIPLFYPLSDSMHRFPSFVMEPNFVSSFGIALSLYFGFIAVLVFSYRVRRYFN